MRARITGIFVLLLIFLTLIAPPIELLHAGSVREPSVAGRFYPGSQKALTETIQGLFGKVPASGQPSEISALISPHAGYVYSGQTAAYGYKALKGKSFRTVILLGPSHHAGFHGLSIPDVDAYRTPMGEVPLDRETCTALRKHPLIQAHPSAHKQEHSLEVQLPFLQDVLQGFSIVPILVGHLEEDDYRPLARAISEKVDQTTLLVASSDFTHYGPRFDYLPFTQDPKKQLSNLDHDAFRKILALDRTGFLSFQRKTGDTICGYRPIGLLMDILSGQEIPQGNLLHYTTSGEITGDFTNSVSYASLIFYRRNSTMYLNPEEKKTLLHLARLTLDTYVRDSMELKSAPKGTVLTERLKEPAGAFVTLEKKGQLRGCIGYIEPVHPLYESVMDNAVSACSRDYRFPPVKASELEEIELEISVLTPKEEVAGPEGFVPGEHGIIIEKNGKRAVFLPQVATEQGWDREETLRHLCRKAGLPSDAWKQGCRFWVFRAEVFGENHEK